MIAMAAIVQAISSRALDSDGNVARRAERRCAS